MNNSPRCTFILLLSIFSFAPFCDYTLTSLNPMLSVVQDIYNQTYMERYHEPLPEEAWFVLLSVTLSIVLAGAFVGSITFKILLHFLTRKQVMLCLHVCNIIGMCIIVFGVGIYGSYECFIVGRFVTGVYIGLGMGVLPVLVSETCTPRRVNFFCGMIGASFCLGSTLGLIIGWYKVLGTAQRFYGVFLVQMIPSFAYIGYSYWIPITPFQAYMKYGTEEATRVLRILRTGDENDLEEEIEILAKECEKKDYMRNADATIMEVLKTPQYRRHFITIVILICYLMLSGLENIYFYSDYIFQSAGIEPEFVTPASIGVFALGIVVSVVGMFIVEIMEPRTLLLMGSSIIIVGHALLTASTATFERVPFMSYFSIVGMCMFFIGFVFIEIPIFGMIGTLSIDRTRAACSNVGGAITCLLGLFVGFICTYLQVWMGAYTFLVWMGCTIAATVYIIFFVPKTKGKTSEEIQEFFKEKQDYFAAIPA